MTRTIRAALLFALVLATACTAAKDKNAVASNFKLLDLDGKTVQLSDFKGRPVMIDFWATWCPPCRETIPALVKLHKTYAPRGLVVLGISMDEGGWDSVQQFVRSHGITYPVLKGNDAVQDAYQVRTIPMIVFIDKEGKMVRRFIGVGGDGELDKAAEALL